MLLVRPGSYSLNNLDRHLEIQCGRLVQDASGKCPDRPEGVSQPPDVVTLCYCESPISDSLLTGFQDFDHETIELIEVPLDVVHWIHKSGLPFNIYEDDAI